MYCRLAADVELRPRQVADLDRIEGPAVRAAGSLEIVRVSVRVMYRPALAGPAARHEILEGEGRLARAGIPLQEVEPLAEEAAAEDVVEPRDPGRDGVVACGPRLLHGRSLINSASDRPFRPPGGPDSRGRGRRSPLSMQRPVAGPSSEIGFRKHEAATGRDPKGMAQFRRTNARCLRLPHLRSPHSPRCAHEAGIPRRRILQRQSSTFSTKRPEFSRPDRSRLADSGWISRRACSPMDRRGADRSARRSDRGVVRRRPEGSGRRAPASPRRRIGVMG